MNSWIVITFGLILIVITESVKAQSTSGPSTQIERPQVIPVTVIPIETTSTAPISQLSSVTPSSSSTTKVIEPVGFSRRPQESQSSPSTNSSPSRQQMSQSSGPSSSTKAPSKSSNSSSSKSSSGSSNGSPSGSFQELGAKRRTPIINENCTWSSFGVESNCLVIYILAPFRAFERFSAFVQKLW
ncbi:putative protein TPRXL isoform X1 [Trichogramma pretiosum]|uniref:putative protein TPRXL isoform X1 n=1 Tax=Trichogramma pretiosum TaxID=7493 RepID=UPI0006C96926|nr:putative protein TPRXL isoform X1 [Trichogramma pretiosum]